MSDSHLFAANGTKIAIFGITYLEVSVHLDQTFLWNFVLADVNMPILENDILEYFGLIIDLKNKQLLDPNNNSSKDKIQNC